MANLLLDRMLPAELAENSQVIEYKGVIAEFERLREISERELHALTAAEQPRDWSDGPVEALLEFGWLDTDQAMPAATGHVRTALPAVCQRCLETFELAIDTPVRLLFCDEARVPTGQEYDAWDTGGEAVRLLDIIEESVVMAMPLAPLHASVADCGALAKRIAGPTPDAVRPFADLRAQMDKMNK